MSGSDAASNIKMAGTAKHPSHGAVRLAATSTLASDFRNITLEVSGAGARRAEAVSLYTSDAADEEDSVDLGGRRIIKKKKQKPPYQTTLA